MKDTIHEYVLASAERGTIDEPIPASKIVGWMKIRNVQTNVSVRAIQEAVHELRKMGYPICANGRGYYWPADAEELNDFVKKMKKRTKAICIATAGLQKAYDKIYLNSPAVITAE